MFFQKASSEDFQGILDLQHKNFIHNLTDSEKKDGFLSVEFTKEQFETMNNQTGMALFLNPLIEQVEAVKTGSCYHDRH